MFIKKIIKFFKELELGNPVKYCEVYKNEGCCHVDGLLCDYPNCSILEDYKSKENERTKE